ncbi:hypothetical protein BDN72DRAFT_872562 [Pluteus cervinus]|uniref:Uncharacterized protein n=1 Tax=Pluteus cervinus TaxID=181527 RepID=A0ACD3A9L1_9AGAR|nr:hypothetical protein BDN72DRAFT_872562 [Pluteus cervinus]
MVGRHLVFEPSAVIFSFEEKSMSQYSILPALSLNGILHFTVTEQAMTGELFYNFIEGLLGHMQCWPLPNSVIVMDNASIHKAPEIRELAFSALKSWLRKYRTYVSRRMEGQFADPYALLEEAAYAAVTPAKIWGWYRHSKYI